MSTSTLVTLRDTAEYGWMMEFLTDGFPETGDNVGADLNRIGAMVQAQPKHAQFTMQFLAQDVRRARGHNPSEPERLAFLRFALGTLFLAYVGVAVADGRCKENEVPPELELLLNQNPEILECANALPLIQV